MGQGYYRKLTDILKEEAGAYYDRQGKGSHERWKTRDDIPLIVSKNCPSPDTANAIHALEQHLNRNLASPGNIAKRFGYPIARFDRFVLFKNAPIKNSCYKSYSYSAT